MPAPYLHGRGAVSSPSILIVEDDLPIRKLLTVAFRRQELHVDAVADGVEALERLDARKYDVMLLDLMLPRVNGFEVLDALARRDRRPLVFVMTAYEQVMVSRLDPHLVQAVVRKPFDLEAFVEIVRECATVWQTDPALPHDAELRPPLFLPPQTPS
jgi:CheY-like chemotaxis protein